MKYAKVKTASSPEKILIPITSEDKPDVPEDFLAKWQKILDLAARLIGVPSGLITRVNENDLEVFLTSRTDDNIFQPHLKLELGLGWYCENVTGSRDGLVLPNALQSDVWKGDNPSLPYEMISYMGVPLLWPDGEVFGTFCMLDNREHNFSETSQELLSTLKEVIQTDLKSILLYRQAQTDILTREAQITEIHHRVKNHFNLLFSTLNLQMAYGSYATNTESLLRDIQLRISAVSEVHDHLYRKANSDVFLLGRYLTELGKQFLSILQRWNVIYHCQSDDIMVPSNVSIPCGLILNELMANSLKYAFSDTYLPMISVHVKREDEKVVSLTYRDNGSGLPEDFDMGTRGALGMLLIQQFVLQLSGTHEIKNDNGFVFKMNFPA